MESANDILERFKREITQVGESNYSDDDKYKLLYELNDGLKIGLLYNIALSLEKITLHLAEIKGPDERPM